MIFEDWELVEICEVLTNAKELKFMCIKNKIEQLRETSKNKRYTLRTTDWLSDAAKKRKFKK